MSTEKLEKHLPFCNKDFIITEKFTKLFYITVNDTSHDYADSIKDEFEFIIESVGLLIGKSYNYVAEHVKFYNDKKYFVTDSCYIDSINYENGQYKIVIQREYYYDEYKNTYYFVCDEDFDIISLKITCTKNDDCNTTLDIKNNTTYVDFTYDENKNLLKRTIQFEDDNSKQLCSVLQNEYNEITGELEKSLFSDYSNESFITKKYKNGNIIQCFESYMVFLNRELIFTYYDYYQDYIIERRYEFDDYDNAYSIYEKTFNGSKNDYVEFGYVYNNYDNNWISVEECFDLDGHIISTVDYIHGDETELDITITNKKYNAEINGFRDNILSTDKFGRVDRYYDMEIKYRNDESEEVTRIYHRNELLIEVV